MRRLLAIWATIWVGMVLLATPALATDYPVGPGTTAPPSVLGTQVTTSTGSGSGLAFTGAEIAATVLFGLALVVCGLLLVRATRRRHATVSM